MWTTEMDMVELGGINLLAGKQKNRIVGLDKGIDVPMGKGIGKVEVYI